MDAHRGLLLSWVAPAVGRAQVRPAAAAAGRAPPPAPAPSGPRAGDGPRPSTPRRLRGPPTCRPPCRPARAGRRRAGRGGGRRRPGHRPEAQARPAEPTDLRFPINLATALRLSDARPLIVAAAQASVWVAEAELTRAKVLWVPTLNIGFDYIRHDGGGPDFNKGIMTAPSVNFFYGGAGLMGYVPSTDAIFEPLVARQVLNARHWDIQAAKNDALLQTADAYFRVHQYRGMYAGALYSRRAGPRPGRADRRS